MSQIGGVIQKNNSSFLLCNSSLFLQRVVEVGAREKVIAESNLRSAAAEYVVKS